MIEKHLTEIGRRLKETRKILNLSQVDVALAAGVSDSSLSEFETGKKRPSSRVLYYFVAEHLVNINFILSGKGSRFEDNIDLEIFGDQKKEVKTMFEMMSKKKSVMFEMLARFSKLNE